MEDFKAYLLKRGVAMALVLYLVLANTLTTYFGVKSFGPGKISVALAVIAAVYLVADKTTFLPFLGETVLPPNALRLGTPVDASLDVAVPAPPGATHAIYWAATTKSTTTVPTPMEAYGGYSNSGVVKIEGPTAIFPLFCPGTYTVRGKELPKHVHYRFVYPSGVFSKVFTQDILC